MTESRGAAYPAPVRGAAAFFSYLFHPVFVPVYISWFLIYLNPVFPALRADDRALLLLRFFLMYSMFPLVTVLLAKGLGFIQSIHLPTQRDRIIPYVASGLYYFWMWYVLRNQPQFPSEFEMLALAVFIASSLGLVLNGFLKVSMHGLSMGVAVVFVCLMAFLSGAQYGIYISITLLLAGAVCTARLIYSDHSEAEVYIGFALGGLAQLVAYAAT